MIGEKIVAIRRDEQGNITHIRTHLGHVLTLEEAVAQAKQGGFDSITSLDSQGNWTIARDARDGEPVTGGNLTILPEF